MFNKESFTVSFYDAVIANDGPLVKKLLEQNNNNNNNNSETKISIRMITGILVIAIESHLYEAVSEILSYNNIAIDKIEDQHLNNILCLISKAGLLGKLNITFH